MVVLILVTPSRVVISRFRHNRGTSSTPPRRRQSLDPALERQRLHGFRQPRAASAREARATATILPPDNGRKPLSVSLVIIDYVLIHETGYIVALAPCLEQDLPTAQLPFPEDARIRCNHGLTFKRYIGVTKKAVSVRGKGGLPHSLQSNSLTSRYITRPLRMTC